MKFTYTYNKKVLAEKLDNEIRMSSITKHLESVNMTGGSICFISFEDSSDLTIEEKGMLDDIVISHNNNPIVKQESLIVNVNEIPPYAQDDLEASYFKKSFHFPLPATIGTYEKRIKWPYDIAILGGKICSKASWVGDSFKVEIAPKTLVGQNMSPVASGSNLVKVDGNCAEYYIWKSDILFLTDGQNVIDFGSVCKKTGTLITVENPAPMDLPAGLGVLVTTQVVPYFFVAKENEEIMIGEKTQRGMFIPAGLEMVITYTSNSAVEKDIIFNLEWYA